MKDSKKPSRLELTIEITTWVIMVFIIFGVRFLPIKLIDNDQVYYLIGAIVAFALLYYLVIYKYFSKSNRLYLKSIADIVLIGILIHVLKDYGEYFYALYFLPIAAAALSLELINALLIATIASLFVIFEIFLNSQGYLSSQTNVLGGFWQIGFILLITIFCRFLAIQIKKEQALKEESLARQKVLEEESKRQKEFLSLTSHQLNTPLSIIRGLSSMFKDGTFGKLLPKQEEAALNIYQASSRMTNLVSELLSVSSIQSGTFKISRTETKLDDLLKNTVKEIEVINDNKQVKINLILPDHLTPIKIDADKIRSVVYNLLDNALKYTLKGEVTVETHQNNKETTIKIKDTGAGIPAEDFDKLFQPFFRSQNILELDNKGTGLGLYISRLIIERHEGKIWAESEGKNKGSAFIFILPNKEII